MNYKKPTFWMITISVIACVIVAICFLTNPKQGLDMKDINWVNLEQYRTKYIGDASKVSVIAQNLPYPNGYSYSSIELQTTTEPYELIVYVDGVEYVQENDFHNCAITAFNLIGNMGIISFRNAESEAVIASFNRTVYEENRKFYLTIGAEGVTYIEIKTPDSGGGCQNADGTPFKKGECTDLPI